MATYNITLNSSNVVGLNNNTFQYNFITGAVNIPEGATMSVSQITIPYSWRNISASLGNNTWSYTMPNGSSGTTTYGVYTIPDGFYGVSDLNTLFQAQFKANGHFWYLNNSATGTANITYYYPVTLSSNTPLYTNTISSYIIPLSANIGNVFGTGAVKADGNNGTGIAWSGTYPTYSGACCQINFLGTSSPTTTLLGNILGFTSPASYPTTASGLSGITTSQNGNTLTNSPPYPALGSQVNGVIVRCNLVENHIASPTDILDSFPITATYGSNINYLPISNNQIKMKKGRFNNLVVSFIDQNYNPIIALDPNVLITLIINLP